PVHRYSHLLFLHHPPATNFSTLPLHDALPIFGMPDRETFAHFSHDMLGLPTTNSPDGTVTYIRVDRYQHRLAARSAPEPNARPGDRKSTRLNSSHEWISYAVFCLKKKRTTHVD